MTTKPMHPFVKAERRAVRLQARLLLKVMPLERDFTQVNRAWQQAARLHQTYAECQGPGICRWCDLFPELEL